MCSPLGTVLVFGLPAVQGRRGRRLLQQDRTEGRCRVC